jgi:hypothetical protein
LCRCSAPYRTTDSERPLAKASTIKASDTYRFFQEDGASNFRTFPIQYKTPSGAAFLRIVVGAARNRLPTAITVDVNNLR